MQPMLSAEGKSSFYTCLSLQYIYVCCEVCLRPVVRLVLPQFNVTRLTDSLLFIYFASIEVRVIHLLLLRASF